MPAQQSNPGGKASPLKAPKVQLKNNYGTLKLTIHEAVVSENQEVIKTLLDPYVKINHDESDWRTRLSKEREQFKRAQEKASKKNKGVKVGNFEAAKMLEIDANVKNAYGSDNVEPSGKKYSFDQTFKI
mmetsp:Transcript_13354/g.22709  ORF Transcript_13354/g.22709 Transcript_13354/m.22709 type:complete len:129 (-) Transcript_13354:828-1214(-)